MTEITNGNGLEDDTKKGYVKLNDIPEFCKSHCKIRDEKEVERIINELIRGGIHKLQLISDFDFTITKQRLDDGTLVPSSFGMFNACKSLSQQYKDEATKLYQKYRPIEIDPKIPHDEKVQKMIEWWTKTGELLMGFPFNHEEIDEVAAHYSHGLRDGTDTFLSNLYKLDVPVLVFSAGLGDSVVSVLRQANVLFPNVKVVSNFLQYKNGILNGLQEPMIHTFNKNETVLEGSEYYDLVHERDHVILMGDSISDAQMANGVPKSSHILKIGFLFHHVEEYLERYMDTFDIVLIDDQTMTVPTAIVKLITDYTQIS